MAEAATAIQLIQFSGIILSSCYEYISIARNAPKEIQKVIDELSSLRSILENLKLLIESSKDERFVTLKSLDGSFKDCNAALKEIDEKLKGLTVSSNLKRRMQWPLEAGKIEAILKKVREHKLNFVLALAGDNGAISASVENAVEVLQKNQEKENILNWLSGSDPTINHIAAKKNKEKGTCEWLISSLQFKSFMNGKRKLMWMHGIPGAGKTVLTSAVIDHISTSLAGSNGLLLYYYFDFRDQTKRTSLGLLQSLVRQYCLKSEDLVPEVQELMSQCKGVTPSSEQLIETLILILDRSSTAYIVIDALDECMDEAEEECNEVLNALRDIKNGAGTTNIFVASRPEGAITREMTEMCDIDMDIVSALIDEDIRCHVRSCLSKDTRLKRWPNNVKEEIEDKLTTNARGMFRWVFCQLNELRKCLKPSRIREELNNLPKTLDTTYARILRNIPEIYHREMKTVLVFLAFSERPMTIQEVAEATAVNLESQFFSIEERFPDAYDILQVCSSLVSLSDLPNDPSSELRREGPYRFGNIAPDIRVLQFAHFSVKEFILSTRAEDTLPRSLQISPTLCHSFITQTCLVYLLDFNNGEKVSRIDHKEFPLLAYAGLHWMSHLTASATMDEDDRERMKALFMRLFDVNNENNLMNFLNIYNPDRIGIYGGKEVHMGAVSRNMQDFSPPMYYACLYGLSSVVEYLLANDTTTNTSKEVLGSGLAAASSAGFVDIVDLLLQEGADPNSPYCGKYWRPLHAAAAGGNVQIVKRLLEAGSIVNAHGGSYGSALHAAAEGGHCEVIHLLIAHGHDLYPGSPYHGPPLSAALLQDKDEAAVTLVMNKVDVNTPPSGYFNPLNIACANAKIDTIQVLLKNGAISAAKSTGSQALHNAAKRGDISIMQLLLAHGADVNGSSDSTYRTPLKGAIQARKEDVFDFMLRNGADVNGKGASTMYPIDQAIFGGNMYAAEKLIKMGALFGDNALEEAIDYHSKEYLAKMLLDRGANPNAEHLRYGNILQFAALRSSSTCVQWLLEAGADPNDICDGEYGSPLQAAAYRGKDQMLLLLLKYGAHVNPTRCSGRFGNPLQAAISDKNETTINLLLNSSTDVNATGGRLWTPLQAAARAGLASVVNSLIEKGAHINTSGGRYGTALRAAIANDHIEIVRTLLQANADPNIEVIASHTTTMNSVVIEEYSSALEVAAATNNPEQVEVLCKNGLSINSDGKACSAALKRASEMPDCKMLQFLIEKGADIAKFGAQALSSDMNRYDEGKLEKIQLLLKYGANANGSPGNPISPLSSSICHKRWAVMALLLDAGCNVNAVHSGLNGSALHEAIDKVDVTAVKELIRRGADVNLRAGKVGIPLALAIAKGDEELFKLLLEHGAKSDSNPPYGYWGTPLQAAVSRGYFSMAYELLDRGADSNGVGFYASPLTSACRGSKPGQLIMIQRLISLGADLEAEDTHRPEDDNLVGTRYYWTPLQTAVYSGNEIIVELLLKHGAKVNTQTPKGTFGYPLQAAVESENEPMTKFLLQKGAIVNAVGGQYSTAIQAAAAKGTDQLVKILLDAGADPSIEGGYYGSPLQASSRLGKKRHVELFLNLGVPVNTSIGKYGNSLAAAAKRANREIVEILIDHGADVNQLGGKYGTPLQAACCATGSTARDEEGSIVKLLLDNGADINASGVGKYGTALQAAAYHDRKYVEILLRRGADPNIHGGKFGSALQAARRKDVYRVERMLLQYGAKEEDSPNVVEKK